VTKILLSFSKSSLNIFPPYTSIISTIESAHLDESFNEGTIVNDLPPFSINNSLYSSSISYNVSKLSAVKAGERTSIFSMPLFGKLSRTSSVKGSSQFFVNLDWNETVYLSGGRLNLLAISLVVS
jgi:hypothetical protein